MPFNDIEAVKAAITPNTAAVMLEPIQGESGIKVASPEYLRALRALCDETGVLLALDEVQCGVGRTGRLFAHEWAGIKPDIVSTAKGLGGGFPIGAILTTETIAKSMTPGTHGTTFGGNPLACAAGNAVLDVILAPGFLDQVCTRAALLDELLDSLVADAPDIFAQRRGLGLLIGLRCVPAVGDVQGAAQNEGLLCVTAGDNVLRLVPPLTVSEEECRKAVALLVQAVSTLRKIITTRQFWSQQRERRQHDHCPALFFLGNAPPFSGSERSGCRNPAPDSGCSRQHEAHAAEPPVSATPAPAAGRAAVGAYSFQAIHPHPCFL